MIQYDSQNSLMIAKNDCFKKKNEKKIVLSIYEQAYAHLNICAFKCTNISMFFSWYAWFLNYIQLDFLVPCRSPKTTDPS